MKRPRCLLAALLAGGLTLFALSSFHASHAAHRHFLDHYESAAEAQSMTESAGEKGGAARRGAAVEAASTAAQDEVRLDESLTSWRGFQERIATARAENQAADLAFLNVPVARDASPAQIWRTWERTVESDGNGHATADDHDDVSFDGDVDERNDLAAQEAALEADLERSRAATEAARWDAMSGGGLASRPPPPSPPTARARPPSARHSGAHQSHAAHAAPSARSHRPRHSRGGEPKCGGAPQPFDPLHGGAGPITDADLAEHETTRRRRSRRRLQAVEGVRNGAFAEAGRGGKFGVSCEPSAPVKARQACLERKFLKRCSDDDARAKKLQVTHKPTADEQLLAKCMSSDFTARECAGPGKASRIQSAARGLKGIQMLLDAKSAGKAPSCLLYSKGKACGEILSNEESGLTMGCGERGSGFPVAGCDRKLATGEKAVGGPANPIERDFPLLRARDVTLDAYHTCAVVGNSMRLFDGAMPLHGSYIDSHDAVFRFNNELERIYHVLSLDERFGESRIVEEGGLEARVGFKTTFRMVNRKYTSQLLDGTDKIVRNGTKQVIPLTFSSTTLRPGEGDARERPDSLLFWHYSSAPFVRTIQRKYKAQAGSIDLIAPEFANWLLNVFAQLRVDLLRLGLGPFTCYRSISSGVHGTMLAHLMCSRPPSIFGFSVSTQNFAEGFNHGRPSQSHSWDFETSLMKLLYAAGIVNVCNA